MELFDAIHNRQTQGKVKQDPLPRETIEKLLSAAVQAPNHYKVRPWRFVVLTGEGRNKLGDVMAASQMDQKPDLPQEVFDKTRSLPLRAPVVIAVGVDKPSEEKVIEIENIERGIRSVPEHTACRPRAGARRDLAHRRMGA